MSTLRRRAAVVFVSLAAALGIISPTAAQATVPPPPTTWTAECPPTIQCVVQPAAYVANGGDVTDYGNYDITNRPSDLPITTIVIHDTEGTCDSASRHFDDPTSYVSAHYIVCRDGTVIQKVQTKDYAWHAGNWWMNGRSIGVEHEGHADQNDYTAAEYHSSILLVDYLVRRFGIPRDRGHILGHDNIMGAPNGALRDMHTDPGPYWNWMAYMTALGAPSLPSTTPQGAHFVTVAPTWPLSRLPVTDCSEASGACGAPTNFVYLQTEARRDAPFITDPVLGAGDTRVSNNAARVFYGQTFALAEPPRIDRKGVWYRIYVNGGTGWFYSPWTAPTGLPVADARVQFLTPTVGMGAVPTYARPIPEKSEYPTEVVTPPSPGSFWIRGQEALPYKLQPGQKYTVFDLKPLNDYFYAWSSTGDQELYPGDHTVYHGATEYIGIQLGSRVAYVKKSDVTCQPAC